MPEKITAPTMTDLIAKIYIAEGWKHRVNSNKTRRVLDHYTVVSDPKTNIYTATKKERGLPVLEKMLGKLFLP